MTHTAENVARKYSITMQEQHEVVLRRLEQYRDATKDECKFQRRYMTLPFEVPTRNLKKNEQVIQGDEGVFESSAEGLAKLRPVLKDGTVTFGSQTHPADGNAAMILATREEAKTLSRDASIRIEAVGFGQARADLGFMPEATVPAAARALSQARIGANELHVVKSHNPFAVNDIVLSRGLGLPLEQMNNFGCSLVWGHPQAPTALRSIIEVIEELVLRGGGLGLFTGCAAGDSAMAVVLKVSNR
jgi:acetyl-CoA acetyltransferase